MRIADSSPPPIGMTQRHSRRLTRRILDSILLVGIGLAPLAFRLDCWPCRHLNWQPQIVEFVDRESQLMTEAAVELPRYDRTARKAHQWTMVVLVAAGLILQGVAGSLLIAIAGAIMLVGRFWWPADVVRQLVWRALEPAGLLKRNDVHEDHETRRVARVIGGAIWLIAAAFLLAGIPAVTWVLSLPIAVMVALDASLDFCALCFLVVQLDR